MGDQEQHEDICKFKQAGFCTFGTKFNQKHNDTIWENENECCGKLCSERHPMLCRNISKTGICRHKENCAYKHKQEKNTNQGFVNDAIMMCIVWQEQQITALSEEVKCLKLLVGNISKENAIVETVYPDDKEVTGKMSPEGEKEYNILVQKTSKECYKCEECNYRSESEMPLEKYMSIKHQCQKPESVSDAKLFCHECNFSYKTKKSFKNHMSKIHFIPKT